MEKFLNLPVEKQNAIIDAALISFGTNGYKKTSMSDIATAAGISKAMVFHYFGTKKALYLYLIDLCGNIVIKEIEEKFDNTIADFFDRIKLSSNIKIAVMKRHPAILDFLTSAYFETNDEVKEDLKTVFAKSDEFRSKIAFVGMDASKFKDGIDPKLVMKMLVWMAEGFVGHFSSKEEFNLEVLIREFDECLNLLKNNFYKEEYL